MFQDNTAHVFVATAALNVNSAAGQCAVTEGDVLQLTPGQAPGADGMANVVVLASKGQDCQKGAMVAVGIADLQDMQNGMRQTIDQGMAQLQEKQGQGGLPPIPASAKAPPTETAFAKIAPPPPPDGAQQISQEWDAGNKAEQTPVADATAGQPAIAQPAEPVQLGLGLTIDEVVSSQGQPVTIANLGPNKKLYVFKNNIKVTFTNGKVTDIQ